jgi:hypothetical protein
MPMVMMSGWIAADALDQHYGKGARVSGKWWTEVEV